MTAATPHNGASKARRTPTLAASMKSVRGDVDKLVEDVGGLAQAASVKARAHVADLATQARERGRGALMTFGEQVRANPRIALGAAVGLGVIAGLLLARRR